MEFIGLSFNRKRVLVVLMVILNVIKNGRKI
jgi:hypothetical protein